MRGRRVIPDKRMSAAQGRTQMVSLLYSCRATALAGFTVDDLVRTHRVDARTAEYELTIAKQKRAGELA